MREQWYYGDMPMRKVSKPSRTQRIRRRERGKRAVAPVAMPSGLPACSTCGRPLNRLPAYLAAAVASGAGFQCERCFFPGTGRAPAVAGVVSAETTRWWADLAEEPSGKEVVLEEPEEG